MKVQVCKWRAQLPKGSSPWSTYWRTAFSEDLRSALVPAYTDNLLIASSRGIVSAHIKLAVLRRSYQDRVWVYKAIDST